MHCSCSWQLPLPRAGVESKTPSADQWDRYLLPWVPLWAMGGKSALSGQFLFSHKPNTYQPLSPSSLPSPSQSSPPAALHPQCLPPFSLLIHPALLLSPLVILTCLLSNLLTLSPLAHPTIVSSSPSLLLCLADASFQSQTPFLHLYSVYAWCW